MRAFLIWSLAATGLFAADRREIDISASQVWTDTGIDLRVGDTVVISATGTIEFDPTHICGPAGVSRGWADLMSALPVNDSGRGALIGRFSDNAAARPFVVGANVQKIVPISARLFLGINETASKTATGSFHVVIERSFGRVTEGPLHLPHFTQRMLDDIPTRVVDLEGNLGDRVNFILIGSLKQVQDALNAAGWVLVDKNKKDAVLHGLVTSLSKQSYVNMPMSPLTLFGRVQDFGYAQGDPLKVVGSRHHFRLWKAFFEAEGVDVWVGAGTHDVGFDKDNRNNGITHKIDPATDGERDYIGESLRETGLTAREDYMMPSDPIKQARTATGEGFTSDGRVLIIYVKPLPAASPLP
jgi:hypothetical protein